MRGTPHIVGDVMTRTVAAIGRGAASRRAARTMARAEEVRREADGLGPVGPGAFGPGA
ncbi:hypothetical protein KMT30_21265 [Streptomyces sp. IBSBF 2953]|uniref:hypothetical protein n=1 Tax=Streptomyces TaxID=1883 RepID=UPI00211A3B1C|nr:hypothetical protein [Streptomyces scabiei]MCQ9181532.1 hypothetical protein [Streptomyces hayashii]MDX3111997.1 hypothetical protein [Streptomyces scabiei]